MTSHVIAGLAALSFAALVLTSTQASAQVKSVHDKSLHQSAWEGTRAAAVAIGGFSKFMEIIDPKDYLSNIDLLAAKR